MTLAEFLDRPIAFHRPFVEITGSICGALMLSQAMYWSKRTTAASEGWFFKTQEEWQAETGMSRKEQETARKALLKTGLWEEKYERLSHRMFYRVNLEALWGMLQRDIPQCPKVTFGNATLGQSSLIEEETTEETTLIDVAPEPEADEVEQIEKTWNELFKGTSIPLIQNMSEGRKKSARARLENKWWRANWREGMGMILGSDFLAGKAKARDGERPFTASIDFFLRPETLAKITEGAYRNREKQHEPDKFRRHL